MQVAIYVHGLYLYIYVNNEYLNLQRFHGDRVYIPLQMCSQKQQREGKPVDITTGSSQT